MKYQLVCVWLLLLLLSACTQTVAPTLTLIPTPQPSHTPLISVTPSVSPSTTPTPPARVLTICMGAQPETLDIYQGSMLAMQNILSAIYDGPIDLLSYRYQPVILEKIPNLADGDVVIQPVAVKDGDQVIVDSGDVLPMSIGQIIRPYGCYQPECAVVWDGSPIQMAQMAVTYTLREGLRWSDGEPLIAADSVYSFHAASSSIKSDDQTFLLRTASYVAVDDRTVRWTGIPGFIDMDYQDNFFLPLPAHLSDSQSAVESSESGLSTHIPLGWGAYVITEYKVDRYIRLSRNPYYYRAVEGLPYFDEVIYRFFGQDPAAGLEAIQNGKCDILDQEAAQLAWGQALFDLEAAGKIKVHLAAVPVWEHADFNLRPLPGAGFAGWDEDGDGLGPFGDIRLRRAVALCIDRQAMADAIYFGRAPLLDSYLPPEHPLHTSGLSAWQFNPAAAAALLDEIGWLDTDGDPATPRLAEGVTGVPDGVPLEFSYETTATAERQQTAPILAASLVQCGIKVNILFYPAAEWFANGPEGRLFGRRFDMAQFAWLTAVQPSCNLYLSEQIPGAPNEINPLSGLPYAGWSAWNVSSYSSPAFDRVCRSALQALPGTPAYAQNHIAAQVFFATDLPAIPLYPRLKWIISRPDLCGFRLDPTASSNFWNIEEYRDCP